MKKLSFYTILCCLAVVCTFSLNSCQEFNIDSQAEFPPLLETDAQPEIPYEAYSLNRLIASTLFMNFSLEAIHAADIAGYKWKWSPSGRNAVPE